MEFRIIRVVYIFEDGRREVEKPQNLYRFSKDTLEALRKKLMSKKQGCINCFFTYEEH